MKNPGEVCTTSVDKAYGLITVHVPEYFNEQACEQLWVTLQILLESGNVNVVIDMKNCGLINSMAIGKLLEIVIDIDEAFAGQTIFSGMSGLISEALSVSGILTVAQAAPNLSTAIELAKMKKA